jgi:hypothetical protein
MKWSFFLISLQVHSISEIIDSQVYEKQLLENSITSKYGNILLREKVIEDDIIKMVYICYKNPIITVVYLDKYFNIINITKHRKVKRKIIKTPKIFFSQGVEELSLTYFKKRYKCLLKLSSLVQLVKDWDNENYNIFLQITPQYISEIL